MRIRQFALFLFVIAAVVPLVSFGLLTIRESQETTVQEAKRANQRLAQSLAGRIDEYLQNEMRQLQALGTAIVVAQLPVSERVAESSLLDNPRWRNLTILDTKGNTRMSFPKIGYTRPQVDFENALLGKPTLSSLRPAEQKVGQAFGHTMSVALPIYVVGSLQGAILVDLDLVSVWRPVHSIRVGKRGFVRLMALDGTVLAHGDPEERQDVFAGENQLDLLERAMAGQEIVNGAGERSIAVSAVVEEADWVVIIEQPVSEAYEAARSIRTTLIWLIGVTVVVIFIVGLWTGRRLMRSLEMMEEHTKILALGDLTKIVEVPSKVHEIRELANSINQMAGSLEELHTDAKQKERITTFGRVAAGLAHDLRQPLETIEVASQGFLAEPEDEESQEFFQWTMSTEMPRLRRYLDDLQHLATEGDVGLQRSKLLPQELLASVKERLAGARKWEEVSFQCKGSVGSILADRNLLTRAVYNICANGADATIRQGGGIVMMEIFVETSECGETLVIEVTDDGCGMSQEALELVLAGDFQSTKRVNGVGLGFGVARHIVESHGGRIHGQSELGVGTCFSICIPFVDGEVGL